MRYRDLVTLYPPKNNVTDTGPDAEGSFSLKAIIEETSGLTRGNGYDASIGDAHVYMPGRNSDLVNRGYHIAGFYLKYSGQLYRIMSVSIGRKVLTTNQTVHIECDLERVDKVVS